MNTTELDSIVNRVSLIKRLNKIQVYTDRLGSLSNKKRKELEGDFFKAGIALESKGNYKKIFIEGKKRSSGFLKKFYAELENCTPQEIDIISKHIVNEKQGEAMAMPLEEIIDLLKSNPIFTVLMEYDCGVEFLIAGNRYFIRSHRYNTLMNQETQEYICDFSTIDIKQHEVTFLFNNKPELVIELEESCV